MFTYKREIPEGTEDVLKEKRRKLQKVEGGLRNIFQLNGYSEVQTPTFEYYDVFASLGGSLQQENMVKFLDPRGRILVLRPDMTTPIARLVATKYKDVMLPLRLSYIANIFRIDHPNSGKEREFVQGGVELIGISGSRGDGEVISLAIKALLDQGITGFQIDVGHNGFFRALTNNLNIDDANKEKLRRIIDKKNMVALEEFIEKCPIKADLKDFLYGLPFFFGQPKDVLAQVEKFNMTEEMERELATLKETLEILDDYGVLKYIALDFGLVSEMNYYTGLIFRGLVKDLGYTVLSGGRYDNLIGNFGMDCPATGFAINVNRMAQAMEIQGLFQQCPSIDYRLIFDDINRRKTFQLAETLRGKGFSVELAYRDEDAPAGHCNYICNIDRNSNILITDKLKGIKKTVKYQDFIERLEKNGG